MAKQLGLDEFHAQLLPGDKVERVEALLAAESGNINPVADTVANANYRGADVDWYVKADDIVPKNKGTHAGNPQNNATQQSIKK